MELIVQSIDASIIHSCNRMKYLERLGERAKYRETRMKNLRNSDAIYAEFRELYEDANYVTLAMDYLND
jgi:hypothetical protein